MDAKARTRRTPLPPPPRHAAPVWQTVVESWRAQPVSLALLRAFLGLTFLYAGIQKLLDPNFLHPGSPDYIGSQLRSFAQGSPIGPLLQALVPFAGLVGIAIAITEIAIGLGSLVGVAPVAFALAGFAVNLTLTLSATWHVHPYFLGSDSIYAVAWLAYGIGVLEIRRRARTTERGRSATLQRRDVGGGQIGRREFVRGAALGVATLATAAVAVAFEGRRAVSNALAAERPGPTGATGGTGHAPVQGPVDGPTGASGAASTTQGTPIAELSSIPVGGAIPFDAPGLGPAALVRVAQDEVVAYSRTCTHAGCEVGYDQSAELLVCPCHGAEFDPARGAAPVAGPAPTALQKVDVGIDQATGQVMLLS